MPQRTLARARRVRQARRERRARPEHLGARGEHVQVAARDVGQAAGIERARVLGHALRHYLASFGIECAPRSEGERDKTAASIAAAIDKMLHDKLKPSIVYVWAPAPNAPTVLGQAVRKLRNRHVDVRWLQPAIDLEPAPGDAVQDAGFEAVRVRAEVAQERGARVLRKLGARPATLRRVIPAESVRPETEPAREPSIPPPAPQFVEAPPPSGEPKP